MKFIPRIFVGCILVGLAACTPADEQYCQRFGVGGTAEFGKCISYYHAQDDAFNADRAQCEFEADATYPRSLYDDYHTEYVQVFGGPYGFPHREAVTVGPDYYHNRQVDALRMRIIAPCMETKGWNSPDSWQAGRHPVKSQPHRRISQMMPNGAALPWLK